MAAATATCARSAITFTSIQYGRGRSSRRAVGIFPMEQLRSYATAIVGLALTLALAYQSKWVTPLWLSRYFGPWRRFETGLLTFTTIAGAIPTLPARSVAMAL